MVHHPSSIGAVEGLPGFGVPPPSTGRRTWRSQGESAQEEGECSGSSPGKPVRGRRLRRFLLLRRLALLGPKEALPGEGGADA
jgi:hypothetical protein